jgi:hypothetical protein
MASQYSVQATELAGRKGKLRFAGKKLLYEPMRQYRSTEYEGKEEGVKL